MGWLQSTFQRFGRARRIACIAQVAEALNMQFVSKFWLTFVDHTDVMVDQQCSLLTKYTGKDRANAPGNWRLRACPRVSPHPYLYEDDFVVTMGMPAGPLPPVWPPKEKNKPPKEKNKK
jgi:hypothetical protein